ncbi:reprolysin-like metallopeptidase [Faecalibacter sp. LW9]|uniref:zinc-dependent metalloprotease n=1 Tax=Faecalibacter sp. LW9 TaxID=3103144 RepID=UPI002AFFBDFC|nr:zinc-dependent metalloprotease family protein [Faecalibacter sp. LW9]
MKHIQKMLSKSKILKKNIPPRAIYALDHQIIDNLLSRLNHKSIHQTTEINFPNAHGEMETFVVWESSNFAEALQERFPHLRAFTGYSKNSPHKIVRFSSSHKGLSVMIMDKGISTYIEPYDTFNKHYIVYDSHTKKPEEFKQFQCAVEGEHATTENEESRVLAGNFKTYRLALSNTGEYGQYHGGTVEDVLAAMNNTMTRLNAIFEKDLSIHFNLIEQVPDQLIFVDPTTDPYSSGGPAEAHRVIRNLIDTNNYDMGHLLDKEDANGSAYLESLCDNTRKGGGWTAHNIPDGAFYDVDYVAHEMGHQLGAGHTYTIYSIQSDQTVEIGSGNTIMGYTGITGTLDVQSNSYDYFHSTSIAQIKNHINRSTCGVTRAMETDGPSVNAGADYTIPKTTPFVLTSEVSGPDLANFTHNWEQIDMATSAQMGNNSLASPTKIAGPNFKSLLPGTEHYRYLPDFNAVLAGVLSTKWESVSSVGRDLNFSITVRNNHSTDPQTARDDVKVTVSADAGPFMVTAPAEGVSTQSGQPYLVTWDIANTNHAPINTSQVNIKFSKDGGQTFTYLIQNTPNDGEETITIPAGSQSDNAYIIVEAVDNIYYAVSPSFVVDYEVRGEICNTYTYNGNPIAILDGPGGSEITSPEVTAPLIISDEGNITRVKVGLNVTHPNVNHLTIGIENPQGNRALVWNRTCSNRANINATFDDTATNVSCVAPISGNNKSNELLKIFNGKNAAGEWKIYASDNMPGNTGQINSFSLEVCKRDVQTLNVSDWNKEVNLNIYPNPSNGDFNIQAKNLKQDIISVTIYELTGKIIKTDVISHKGGEFIKNYSMQLPSGVYIINLEGDSIKTSRKIIVK